MAYEADLVKQAFVADTDLSDYQYCAMGMDSDEEVVLASDDGDFLFGVLQDAPDTAGINCTVGLEGITKAKGGAVIAAGALVQVGAGGLFITQSAGVLAGQAYTGCGASGELFSLKICRDSGVGS